MRPAYSGSDKPFVLALFSEKDRERVMPILEELDARGYALCGFEEDATSELARRASSVLAFTSPSFVADEPLHDVLLAADAANVPVIPIQLEAAELPDVLASHLMATNAIMAERYATASDLVDRLVSAEALASQKVSQAQESTQKKRTGMLAALVVVVLAAIGFLAYNALQVGASPDAEIRRMAEENYGMTAEDLAAIHELTVNGEHLVWVTEDDVKEDPYGGEYPDAYFFATHAEDDDGTVHWYWKEDGAETVRTGYDWSFLTILPNLEYLNVANADLSGIPNLAGLEHLSAVDLYSCALPEEGLSFLEGSRVRTMEISGCNVADYSPLSSCEQLERIWLDAVGGETLDLTDFAPPALKYLTIEQAEGDLADLAACTQLEDLELYRCRDLASLGFLEGRTSLKSIHLEDCGALTDASSLAGCAGLRQFYVNWSFGLRDFSFLDGLDRLDSVALLSVPVQDFGFLENLAYKDGFDLAFAPSEPQNVDWSGLAAINHYAHLHVNPSRSSGGSYAEILPYIADATIDFLDLHECDGVDLATLPRVGRTLKITGSDLTSLAGLDQPNVLELQLYQMQRLTSLDGIEGCPLVLNNKDDERKLEVYACPRLTDWAALEGKTLRRLELKYLYALPDFAGIGVRQLRLEGIVGLADLSCLDALPASSLESLELVGLDQVTSLVPAARFANSGHLAVPPQLADQAQALCDDGVFRDWEVAYPEGGWNPLEDGVELISLEDLGVLPPALLGQVDHLTLAGDEVIDFGWVEIDDFAEDGSIIIRNGDTGEEFSGHMGTMADLTRLAPLTGLRELRLYAQGMSSLEGIQQLQSLEDVNINWTQTIEDFSPLFALPELRRLEVLGANVTSIQGIQNLTQLEDVVLSWNQELEDLTPLLACPNLEHVRVSSNMEGALASLEGAEYTFELEIEQAGGGEETA